LKRTIRTAARSAGDEAVERRLQAGDSIKVTAEDDELVLRKK